MNHKRICIGIVLTAMALLLLAPSCSSKKKTVTTAPHADFQWMTAKMTMDITAPGLELNNVTGSLRMRRDSTIWISASALLGMEGLRTLITQDSVIVINRLDQSYIAEPFQSVAGKLKLPMTFQESQAMLLGNGNTDHVELHYGPYKAKIRYSDIRWDEPTTFPIKISKKYERKKL